MRTKYSIKNLITLCMSNIISFIFLFFSQTIFIRILGIEYNGLNGLFTNVLTLLSLFELGIGNTITYNLYKEIAHDNKEKIKSLMAFYKKSYYIVSLIIFILGILIIPIFKFIIKDVNVDINIYIVYLLFLINTCSTYFLSYKRSLIFAYQRNYIISIINAIYIVVLNVSQLLILYITKNYYLYLLIKIICTILENIIINLKANKEYPYLIEKNITPLDKLIKKSIIKRVRALFIHKTSTIITNGSDSIIISAFLGIKYVGLYTNYYYVIYAVETFFKGFITATHASVGNLLVEDNPIKSYTVFKRIIFLNYWIAIITSTCLLILINPFIKIWLGKEFLLDNFALVILIINFFQTMMRHTFGIFKDAAGMWIEDRYIPLLQIAINLIVSIILVKLIGLAGIFIGTIISSLVLWFYSYPKYVYKRVLNRNYKEYIFEFIKKIVVFALIISFIYLFANMLTFTNIILELVIKGFLVLIILTIILVLFNHKKEEFKYYTNLILKR